MNILCIGNSFAVDSATYVHQLAEKSGQNIFIAVLYIGGCPILKHWNNYKSGAKDYEFYINGSRTPEMWCSIHEGLAYKKWDYITFQQVSYNSGDSSTFFPELTYLQEEIRKVSDARYLLHKTWSYGKTHEHPKYGSNPLDSEWMSRDIENAYDEVSQKSGINGIIPVGTAITEARKVFGDELNRDGFHLNELGRTLAGLVWSYYFLGESANFDGFKPSGFTYDDSTPGITSEQFEIVNKIAKEVVKKNKQHNL